MTSELRCDTCRTEIPPEDWNRPEGSRCPGCRKQLWTSVFPSVRNLVRGSGAEAIGAESEASCFYHPNSRAALACDGCGRFLCGLCDLDVAGQHLCPNCLREGVSKQTDQIVDNRRVLYDSIVLGLSIFGPMFFLWPSLVTAPLTLILTAWYSNKPRSIVPRTRVRFFLAIFFALSQVAFWAAVVWSIATTAKKGGPAA